MAGFADFVVTAVTSGFATAVLTAVFVLMTGSFL
jgi:hypothetical protein